MANWTKLDIKPAPSARFGHATCMCGNRFIVFGGRVNGRVFLNDLWSFDLYSLVQGTPAWEQIKFAPGSHSPPGRWGHAIVAYGETLYLFGGENLQCFG
ncbi:hypothetical protein B0J17DRAFT_402612 [Rhizoctonia solani]|nr:hypothetical protein B0J17DRAFT_402612 [Rhizoctonia solani]